METRYDKGVLNWDIQMHTILLYADRWTSQWLSPQEVSTPNWQQRRAAYHTLGYSLPQEQIDLTSTPKKGSKSTKNAPKRAWIENDLYSLSQTDREILLSPTAWLNDNIICAAQMILKEQSVLQNGFQPSTRGQTYTFEIETDDFIQILHNGCGHWLTISTIGAKDDAEVCIYDSMYPSVSTIVKSQIAALLPTKNKEIKLRFMDVQKQCGGYDCGVFVIAFATALAHGINPGKYLFNQHVMRKHLLKCIEMANITMFPVLKTWWAEDRMKSEDAFEIYCTCRMPEYPDVDMIQCKCSEWFHVPFCVSVPRQAMDTTSTEWYCNDCE